MEKSITLAEFQLIDNYISEFSLNVMKKVTIDDDLVTNGNVGYSIINIDNKNMTGQVELSYDISMMIKDEKIGDIRLVMNALFKASNNISEEKFEEMLKINGATTLSHLCRAYINSVTAQSGMPPILIPLINFIEFFKNAEKEVISKSKKK